MLSLKHYGGVKIVNLKWIFVQGTEMYLKSYLSMPEGNYLSQI